MKRIARELGVRYVLEGSIRKVGNRVRITGQLIDGSNAVISGPTPSMARSTRFSIYKTRLLQVW